MSGLHGAPIWNLGRKVNSVAITVHSGCLPLSSSSMLHLDVFPATCIMRSPGHQNQSVGLGTDAQAVWEHRHSALAVLALFNVR